MAKSRYIIGTMTGTSLDGIDVALIRTVGIGQEMNVEFKHGFSREFERSLSKSLRDLANQVPMTARDITIVNRNFAELHIAAIRELLRESTAKFGTIEIDLIVVHGQTVFHAPPLLSWQLFNPTPLAHEFQVPVVFDMRAADLACGGNGAPITPLADWIIFRDQSCLESRAVINLGGFCNVTVLSTNAFPIGSITGGDVCACNQLLDSIARVRFGASYDDCGKNASVGKCIPEVCTELERRLTLQAKNKLSLGTADDPTIWLDSFFHIDANDLARSACAAIAKTIESYLKDKNGRIIVAGGGVHNTALMLELRNAWSEGSVQSAADFGIDPAYREAVEMAVLGALCADKVPITLHAVTGVTTPEPIAGVWVYPTYATRAQHETNTADDAVAVNLERSGDSVPISNRPPDRSHVLTEQRNTNSEALHKMSVAECVSCIQEEDHAVLAAVEGARAQVVAFVEAVEPGFLRGGRLIYLGAGSSGRLGVLDASEAPPTFQVKSDRIIGIIAGGDKALRVSSEGAEDNPNGAINELELLRITSDDAVLGIAAGGSTPYVIGALQYLAKLPLHQRPITGLLTCASISSPPSESTFIIMLPVGPEVITGSTRMKAGTATKLVLNTISTTLMVRSGKVYENLMVDLKASNAKLKDRAARIISTLTGLDRESAFSLLDKAKGSCKAAVVMHKLNVSNDDAERFLLANGGRLNNLMS